MKKLTLIILLAALCLAACDNGGAETEKKGDRIAAGSDAEAASPVAEDLTVGKELPVLGAPVISEDGTSIDISLETASEPETDDRSEAPQDEPTAHETVYAGETASETEQSTGVADAATEYVTDSVPLETEAASEEVQVAQAAESSADGVTYINGVLVANKTYALPESYAPGVDGEAYAALEAMFSAAAADGCSLWVVSGYRSYYDQKVQYDSYVQRDGQALADTYSARPGHSEHQTGLAFDLNSLYQSFGDTEEGRWLAANCHRYGFIVRYPSGKESITGYMYEPWHVRYLGAETAAAVYESGLCLEEYLGITSVYR